MVEYAFRIETAPTDTIQRVIKLSGSITSDNVGEALIHLSTVFDKTDNVIDLSGITQIDFAGLKLICLCHRTLPLSGKVLRITGHDHTAIRDTIQSEGYQCSSTCSLNSSYSCVWSGTHRNENYTLKTK